MKMAIINKANFTVECPLWPDKPGRCEVILGLQRSFSAISLIGCLFVILVIWLFRMYKYFVQRLILFLSVSAALQCVSFLIGDIYTDNFLCEFQAFIMQYFGWATLLWVVAMTVNLIMVLKGMESARYEKLFHLVCWGLPLLWACLPFLHNSYGPAGVWCWIKRDATYLRFGTWYIPIFVTIFAMFVAYIYIVVSVFKRKERWTGTFNQEEEHDKQMLAREVKPLAAFPLIYLLSGIPTLIYRIDDAVHPHLLPSYPLLIFSVIMSPLVGAMNAIAFAVYGEIQKLLTWGQIKSAFLSRFQSDSARIIHNVEIGDNLPDNDYLQVENEADDVDDGIEY
ncbi:cyclic AMP receptor-like protein A [Clytia hemisphaerica]